jgi:hypothetical protein
VAVLFEIARRSTTWTRPVPPEAVASRAVPEQRAGDQVG